VVGVGVAVKVGVMVGVCVAVAVIVGEGDAVNVMVSSGAASTSPPQAVSKTDTSKVKRICFFMEFGMLEAMSRRRGRRLEHSLLIEFPDNS
jgi:nicotinamidase-related amidase